MKKYIITCLMFLVTINVANAQNQEIPEAPFGFSPVEVLTIFNGNFSNRDYENALNFGRWLIIAHPKTMELPGNAQYRADRTFDRMITIYNELAKKENNPITSAALIDTAKSLYVQVLDIFTADEIDLYRWNFEFGRFYQTNTVIDDSNWKAAQQYLKLYELDADRMVKEANGYYIQFVISQLVGRGERDQAIELMSAAEPSAGPETIAYFSSVRDRLFSNPEERIVYLEGLLEASPNDLDLLNELFDLYTRTNNREEVARLTDKLYELNPTYTNIMRMATRAKSNANYRSAIQYLEEAMAKTQDKDQRKEAALAIADNYLNMDNLQRARDFARQAAQIDPSWGQPLLKIAEIYGQAVSSCAGGTMTRQDKVVYWLVLDYMDRARSTDASTRQFVERQYRTYVNASPSIEEKFYMNWTVGDSIRVNGELRECYAWINETTTVR
jgi:tetratricopeptide (TPR) repeat protein